jgi:hypothetical protein
MVKQISGNFVSRILVIPFLFVISSCGSDPNLLKVREFADNASKAKNKFPVIANDIYRSCLREARYRTVSILPPDTLSPLERKEVIEKKISELNKEIQELSVANPKLIDQLRNLKLKLETSGETIQVIDLQSRIEAQKKCEEESSSLGSKMTTGNTVIILYMEKLGSIASENLINFDTQFNELKAKSGDLQTELTAIFKAPNEQKSVSAGLDLANFILTAIFDGKRRETLSEVIPLANSPLKNYSNGLQKVIKRVYIDQYLRREEASLDNYFIDYMQDVLESKARKEGNSVIALVNTFISLDKDWNPKKDEIQERREMANSYISLLQTIIDGHEELAVIYGKGEKPSKQVVENLLDKSTVSLKEYIKQSDEVSRNSQQ